MMRFFSIMALGVFVVLSNSLVKGQSASNLNESQSFIGNDDPTITYAPGYCQGNVSSCFGAWWDTVLPNGTTFKTTGGPFTTFKSAVTSMTFSFVGTSVEVHGVMDTQGAVLLLQLDDQLVPINSSTGIGGPSLVPSLLHTFVNLDANATHTLTLQWAETGTTPGDGLLSLAYFDHLVVGNYLAVAPVANSGSATQDASPSSSQSVFATPGSSSAFPAGVASSSSSAGMSGGVRAVLVVSILIVIGLIAVAVFYNVRIRRRRQASSKQFRIFIESQQERRVDTDGPPSPSLSMLKARPHMSLPPACPPVYEYYTKGDPSYLDLESQIRTNSEESAREDMSLTGHSIDLSRVASTEDRRKTAVSVLSVPPSAYRKDSDAYSVKMCTLTRPRIAKGALVGTALDSNFEPSCAVVDGLPELHSTSTLADDPRSVKKPARQSFGSKLGNTMRKSMKKGVAPPIPLLPSASPDNEDQSGGPSSHAVTSQGIHPPPYVVE